MNRREAISRVAILVGSTVIGGDLFLSGCTNEHTAQILLSETQINYLNEVGESILPKTAASDGAKAANVGLFMQTMVRDCYSDEERKVFFSGLNELEKASNKAYDKGFISCNAQERQKLLTSLDAEAKDYRKKNELLQQKEAERQKSSQASGKPNYLKKTPPAHYFAMIKQLTLLGFFTSETGYKSMGYVQVPGRYDGDVSHKA